MAGRVVRPSPRLLTRAVEVAQPVHVIKLSEQQIIDQLAQRLAGVYTDARLVNEQYSRFGGRPIRDFIPLFVERNATKELAQLAS
jgi:hypothetical protein